MTHPHSLYGRAYFILNLLRGGEPTDDDSYPLPMIADTIASVASEVRQAELNALASRGESPNAAWFAEVKLVFRDRAEQHEPAVRVRTAPLPDALTWNGQPLVNPPRTRDTLPSWGFAPQADYGVRLAKGAPYVPPKPVYWIEPGRIAVALPLKWAGVYEAVVRYVPAYVGTATDGRRLDEHEEALPLSETQWAQIFPLVLQRLGQPLIASSANRDEVNDGRDRPVQG